MKENVTDIEEFLKYEEATRILESLLQSGIISEKEYAEIDILNKEILLKKGTWGIV